MLGVTVRSQAPGAPSTIAVDPCAVGRRWAARGRALRAGVGLLLLAACHAGYGDLGVFAVTEGGDAGGRVVGVQLDPSPQYRVGDGADQWPMTWAADGRMLAAWGNGFGWGGDLPKKRSLGISWFDGPPEAMVGGDLSGTTEGKPQAMLAIGDTVALWWGPTAGPTVTRTAWSNDAGVSFVFAEQDLFTGEQDELVVRGVCQYGRGYASNEDGYVYLYLGQSYAQALYLARVPTAQLLDASAFSWFSGAVDGMPRWADSPDARAPVMVDARRSIWHVGVSYIETLDTYLLTKARPRAGFDPDNFAPTDATGFAMYRASDPWGPWQELYSQETLIDGAAKMSFWLPEKYVSADGSFWLGFSGNPEWDALTWVGGQLTP